ncbi:class I SAM-dependent methyltransferase [Pseudomonas benzenivorans]|uniref:Class I SAM-dependent methyltransferase n=1 Tax=Pseudomonas benzenivorans TaxID=556533 RepID=A0ABY5H9I7_9PSED|nr:class I SAM-dependent methyltransferase [Pseudomonas benzenivorans]UTW08057.1 class I SAM-dependent methyltransferase [Pseudomonas benzenivorans]
MNHSAKFWDRIATRYAKQPVADEAAYQRKLAITREYLQPHMQLLEFGCGTGSTALCHAPHVQHIHGIDLSSKMIEIAQAKAAEHNIGNVTFSQATLDELELAEQSLDVVLGLNILHLLRDKDAAIAKVHRLLKPGGLFVSSTICMGDSLMLKAIKHLVSIGALLRLLPSLDAFTRQQLVGSLTDAGFVIEQLWQPGKNKALFIVAKKP